MNAVDADAGALAGLEGGEVIVPAGALEASELEHETGQSLRVEVEADDWQAVDGAIEALHETARLRY